MLVPFFPKVENPESSQWRLPFPEEGDGNGSAASSNGIPMCCSDSGCLSAQ